MDLLEGLQAKDEQWARALLMTISDAVEDQPLNARSYQVDARQCPHPAARSGYPPIKTAIGAPGGLLWQWLSTRRRRRSAS